MFSGNRLKRTAYALILVGLALLLLLRHREIEEKGTLRWFDRPVLFVTAPVAKGIRAVRNSIQSVFRRYFLLVGVEKENEDLKKSLDEAQAKVLLQDETEKENERLRKLLDLRKHLPESWIAARVVSTPPIFPYRVITLDKGEEDGIRRRAAVVSPDGLVGQVVRVFPHSSQVLLITDPTSAVDGRIEESQSRALVVGKIMKTELRQDVYITAFEYLNRTSEIAEGAAVVTSGMDGVYPPGIPIGRVHGGRKKKYDIFQQAEVLPAVNFYKLREVMVMR